MATAAVVTAAVAAVAGTGYSIYSGEKQRREQKKAAREQQAAINAEKAQALDARKQMIDQQRMQLAGNGSGTRGVSTQGVRARLGNDVLG